VDYKYIHTYIHMSPRRENSPWIYTVVTLCALLTRVL